MFLLFRPCICIYYGCISASMQQPGSLLHHKQHFQPLPEITPSQKSVSITAQNTLTDGCKILRDPCIRIFVVNAPSQDSRYGVDVIAVYHAMRLCILWSVRTLYIRLACIATDTSIHRYSLSFSEGAKICMLTAALGWLAQCFMSHGVPP